MRLYRDHFGQVWSESAASETSLGGLDSSSLSDLATPPAFDTITTLHLNEMQARELQAALVELLALWRPYTASGNGTPFNLSLFFHPEVR